MKKVLVLLLLIVAVHLAAQAPDISARLQPTQPEVGQKAGIVVTYKVPDGFHMNLLEDLEEPVLYVNADPVAGLRFGKVKFPAGKKVEGGLEYRGTVNLTLPVTVEKDGNYKVKVHAGWQICNDKGQCLMPDEKVFSLNLVTPAGASQPAEADTTTMVAPAPVVAQSAVTNPAPVNEPVQAPQDAKGDFLKYLLMAFLGGIILNVMPCVLPVLSIKALHLVEQSHQNRREIMMGSLLYTLGILVSFAVLAVFVHVLKTAGESVGWGFQFQNVGFTLTLTGIIFVFALAMFDVFIITAPGMQTAGKASARKGLLGSFLGGIFAVLLATPCTAPMLGPALGFAFRLPAALIYPFFLVIGLGLALPFLLLGFWPGLVKKLPRPGNWMNTFKEVMGFLLIGTVIFLLGTVEKLVGPGHNFMGVLWFMLVLGFAAWLYGRVGYPGCSRGRKFLALLLVLAMVAASANWLLRFEEVQKNQTASAELLQSSDPVAAVRTMLANGTLKTTGWNVFDPALVETVTKAGKPVFIDFGAEWCATCKANENGVLYPESMQKAFQAKGVILFRGDYTRKDPVITQWLSRYQRAGVPLYLLFSPGEPQAHAFPEIITPGMILAELDKIKVQ